jgi:hypothetical protein
MKKLILASAVAAALWAVAPAAQAIPTLTLSDGTTTVTLTDASGVVTYNGKVGNWFVNVDTGLASPPGPFGGSAKQPYMDLSFDNVFRNGSQPGGALGGNVLTILFTDNNLGPLNGSLHLKTGGTLTGITSDVVSAEINSSAVVTQTFTTSPFALSSSASVSAANPALVGIRMVLTAGSNIAPTTGDVELTVPDAGMTLALLGSALTGLALFGRNRKTA